MVDDKHHGRNRKGCPCDQNTPELNSRTSRQRGYRSRKRLKRRHLFGEFIRNLFNSVILCADGRGSDPLIKLEACCVTKFLHNFVARNVEVRMSFFFQVIESLLQTW